MSRRGWLLFASLCVIWGIPYLLIRIAVREMDPATLVFLRTAPAAVLLAPLAIRRGGLRLLMARWKWVLAYTISEVAAPWLLLFSAETRISSSLAGLLIAAVPLMGALIYPFFDHTERLDARRLLGLCVGFAGVAGVVGLDVRGTSLVAVGEMVAVALGYTLGPLVISRRLADLPSIGVITASLVLTAVAYTPVGLTHLPASLSWQAVASVAGLALVCTAIAFLIFFELIREVGPARTTVITYVNPLVAVLLGVVLLGEPFTVGIAVGLPLIITGSVLATRRSTAAPAAQPVGASPAK